MDYQKFEDHLRNKFHSQEEAVDVSKIMSAVDQARKKTKQRNIVFLLLASIFVSSSVLAFYNYNNTNISNHSTEINQPSISSSLNDIQHTETNTESISLNTETIEEPHVAVMAKRTIDVNPSDETVEAINLTANNFNTSLTSNSQLKSSVSSSYNTGVLDNSTDYSNRNTPDNFKQTSHLISEVHSNNSTFVDTDIEKSLVETTGLNTNSIAKLTNTQTNSLTLQFSPDINKSVECPSFNKNPWIVELGTVMGVSNPVKRFSINPEEINPALTSRAENEKSLEGLDLEFFLSAKRKRWPVFLKSGVAYSRWTEQMRQEENYTEIDTVQGIVSATVSQTGDTITYIYGDIFIEKDIQINRKIHYYINRVSIPLSIVYEKEFGKANAFQAELGASFNIRTFSVGSVYESENTFTPVNVGGFFNTLTGVSYFTKLHYRRYITDKFFLGAQGYFHFLPAEFSNHTSFSQKYNNYGVGIYGGYRF